VISLSSSLTFKSETKDQKIDLKYEAKSPPRASKMAIDEFKIGKKLG